MYDNLEDYIHDQKCNDKNCSSDDVAGSTNEFGDVDNVDGVTCKGTPPDDESEQQTDLNPEHVTIKVLSILKKLLMHVIPKLHKVQL